MTFESEVPPSDAVGPTSEETGWAMAAHLSGFVAAYVALGFLGPLTVYLIKGAQSSFIREHAVEALNFNLTVLIGIVVGVVLSVIGIGILILAAIGIAYVVLSILGAVAAREGRPYKYPATIRFIH